MSDDKNPPRRQDFRGPSRKQMWALWVAVATALGGTGVPKLIEAFSNKPTVEQVQSMIAQQTSVLTEAHNAGVDAFRELQQRVGQLQEQYDGLIAVRLTKKKPAEKKTLRALPPEPDSAPLLEDLTLEMLDKVPAFDVPALQGK
jgi:hypothetical protein